jgi:ubiquinone/menaquinone biosynthesis C-methylase UbiE
MTNLIVYGFAKWLKHLSLPQCAEVLTKLVNLLIKDTSPKKTLQFLFELENCLYPLEGRASIEYGNGIHTKHRHINYHKFFIKNLNPGESVLDIGCGNGFMDYNIVNQIHNVKIVGIDLNKKNIEFACERYRHPNLSFIEGNALEELPNKTFDVIILSNVLEHIEQRVEFLRKIVHSIKPKRLIIRVPLFERDWRVPLKKELGINYRLDSTHYIEYTQEEYLEELHQAGLKATNTEFRWGEIWSAVEPLKNFE